MSNKIQNIERAMKIEISYKCNNWHESAKHCINFSQNLIKINQRAAI